MGRQITGTDQNTFDAWKALVEETRRIYPHVHEAQASTIDTNNMLAWVEEGQHLSIDIIKQRIAQMKAAFPSSPQRPPLLGLSFRHPEHDKRQHHNFAAMYSAHVFLTDLLSQCEYKWVSDAEIEVHAPHYFTIVCDSLTDGLDAVMDYKLTKEEQAWELPEPYPTYIRDILRTKRADVADDAEQPAKVKSQPTAKPERQAQPKKPVKAPKPSAEGLITIGDVAADYGFDAKQARNIMRKAEIDKPEHGRWEWAKVPASVHAAFKAEKAKA